MNSVLRLVVEMRAGAQQLRFQGLVSKPKALLYERWAAHLEDDAKSLQLLAETIEEPPP